MAESDKVLETQSNPLPPLESIYFLKVNVISAKDLESSDFTGGSDPFCKVVANKQSWSTKSIEKTTSPTWNEDTQFVFFDRVEKISFHVFDADKGSKADPIGDISLACGQFYDEGNQGFEGSLKLENAKKGEIQVTVTGRLIKPLEMEKKCEELDAQADKQEAEAAQKKAEVERLMSENEQAAQDKKKLEKEKESKQSEVEGLVKKLQKWQRDNDKREEELQKLRDIVRQKKELIEKYKQDNSAKETEYGGEESKLEAAESENQQLQSDYQAKQAQLEEYEP